MSLLLPLGTSVVGRSSECDIVVNDLSVSRKHAQLRAQGSNIAVTDLGSLNGTYVDDQRVVTSTVRRGQMLRLGHVSFVLVVDDEEEEPDSKEATTQDREPNRFRNAFDQRFELLSAAQKRVFDFLLTGKPEKTIARKLSLSQHTVHNHVRAIFKAFAVHSRAELLATVLGRSAER